MTNNTFLNLPDEKKEKIIAVSTNEFAAKGYRGASINSIVKKLKIAKGSIFSYFGDKEGLFLHIFKFAVEKVKDYLRDVRENTKDQNIFERLKKILQAGVDFTDRHPNIYRVYIRMLLNSDIPLREDMQKSIREYAHEFLCELLYDAKEKNEIRKDLDIKIAAFTIEAVMDRFLQTRILPFLDPGADIYGADRKKCEELIDQIISILKKGI
ncbi:MAG: TetR/AcrR family transcriptional regulator [Desulfobacteraceae bacterium]|nr:TetR/AcrR family transcriptional regulator [Desulfobacteraceae bacterium]